MFKGANFHETYTVTYRIKFKFVISAFVTLTYNVHTHVH